MPELEDIEDENEAPAIRQMREQLKRLEKENKDLQTTKRENAMLKAGIDTNSPVGKMFAKAYDGELDVDAIKAAATEVGLAQASETTEPPVEVDTSTAERSALASGAAADDGKGVDPRANALKEAEDLQSKGAAFDVAAGSYINRLAQAAISGDDRVTIPKGVAW